MEQQRRPTPERIRIMGRFLNATIARAPWLWPLLKRPMRTFFERAAPGWDERTGAGGVEHLAALAKATTHVSPEPERALDLGTGTGEAALFLAREFPRASVRGVDISEGMVRAAQGKVGLDPDGRVAFRVADAAALPYGQDSFDLVVGVNMPPFFAEIARVLRPGGHAIVVSSWGEATPFYTPDAVLDRGFRRHAIEQVAADRQGSGTYWVGRAKSG